MLDWLATSLSERKVLVDLVSKVDRYWRPFVCQKQLFEYSQEHALRLYYSRTYSYCLYTSVSSELSASQRNSTAPAYLKIRLIKELSSLKVLGQTNKYMAGDDTCW